MDEWHTEPTHSFASAIPNLFCARGNKIAVRNKHDSCSELLPYAPWSISNDRMPLASTIYL
jgi:hypothetical protein